jgi:hypothetical protein
MITAYDWTPDTGFNPGAATVNSAVDIGGPFTKTLPFDDTYGVDGVNPPGADNAWVVTAKLKPYTSPALWKADDGLHIGADVTTVPVELSTFEIE